MKNKLSLLIFSLHSIFIFGQCPNRVSHISGSEIINNVDVTVTSIGIVSSINECEDIGPYWIGRNGFEGVGSYTFNFSPPITGLTLSFTSIDNHVGLSRDEIELFINGSHYSVTQPGASIECKPLAVITPQGNIIADPSLIHGGWKNSTISGTIESLTVKNNVVGTPAGAVFSISICDPQLNNNEHQAISSNCIVFPNPFNSQTEIYSNKILTNATITIYNSLGQNVKEIKGLTGEIISVNREGLSDGIYHLELLENNSIYFKTKLSIQN